MAHYVLHQFSNNAKPREKDKKACFSYESTCRRQGYVKIFVVFSNIHSYEERPDKEQYL